MTLKDRLKQLFTEMAADGGTPPAGDPPAPDTEQKEYSLKDGSKVAADKLEAGGILMLVDSAGAKTPAPAGDYTMADDTVVTAGDGGAITAVKAPGTPDAAAPDAQAMREAEQKFGAGTPEDRLVILETCMRGVIQASMGWELREAEAKAAKDAAITASQKLSSHEAAAAEDKKLIQKFTATIEKHQKQLKELTAIVQDMLNTPADDPLEQKLSSQAGTRGTEQRSRLMERIAASKED